MITAASTATAVPTAAAVSAATATSAATGTATAASAAACTAAGCGALAGRLPGNLPVANIGWLFFKLVVVFVEHLGFCAFLVLALVGPGAVAAGQRCGCNRRGHIVGNHVRAIEKG